MRARERVDWLEERHRQLSERLIAADEVVEALESLPARKAAAPEPVRRYGGQAAAAAAPAAPRANGSPRAVKEAWAEFSGLLHTHMTHERTFLWPLAARVLNGENRFRSECPLLVRRAIAEHDQLRKRAGVARVEAMFADPVRKAILEVLDLFEEMSKVEETELFPHLGEESEPVDKYRSPDDVLRSLRSTGARPSEPSEELQEQDEAAGIFGKIRRFFGA